MADAITFVVNETTFITGFGEWTYATTGNTAKRCWNLQCSRQPTYADADTAAAALPVGVGGLYAVGDSRYCQKITIKALAADLTSLYAEAEFGPGAFEPNPLLRPDKVSLSVGGETETWFVDANGKKATTSAGEILDKLPPRTTGGVKLVITGNRSVLPAAALVAVMRPSNANGSAFTVRGIEIDTNQAKLVACSGEEATENGLTYYTVRWELALSPDWTLKIDDYGFQSLVGGVLKPIIGADNVTPVKKPWPLNGSGVKMPNATDAAAQLSFQPYPQTAFSFGWTAAA